MPATPSLPVLSDLTVRVGYDLTRVSGCDLKPLLRIVFFCCCLLHHKSKRLSVSPYRPLAVSPDRCLHQTRVRLDPEGTGGANSENYNISNRELPRRSQKGRETPE